MCSLTSRDSWGCCVLSLVPPCGPRTGERVDPKRHHPPASGVRSREQNQDWSPGLQGTTLSPHPVSTLSSGALRIQTQTTGHTKCKSRHGQFLKLEVRVEVPTRGGALVVRQPSGAASLNSGPHPPAAACSCRPGPPAFAFLLLNKPHRSPRTGLQSPSGSPS